MADMELGSLVETRGARATMEHDQNIEPWRAAAECVERGNKFQTF